MSKLRVEEEWALLLAQFGEAGLQCVLARHEVEKFPTTGAAIAEYTRAREHWTDLVLRTHDFVRDCPRY